MTCYNVIMCETVCPCAVLGVKAEALEGVAAEDSAGIGTVASTTGGDDSVESDLSADKREGNAGEGGHSGVKRESSAGECDKREDSAGEGGIGEGSAEGVGSAGEGGIGEGSAGEGVGSAGEEVHIARIEGMGGVIEGVGMSEGIEGVGEGCEDTMVSEIIGVSGGVGIEGGASEERNNAGIDRSEVFSASNKTVIEESDKGVNAGIEGSEKGVNPGIEGSGGERVDASVEGEEGMDTGEGGEEQSQAVQETAVEAPTMEEVCTCLHPCGW